MTIKMVGMCLFVRKVSKMWMQIEHIRVTKEPLTGEVDVSYAILPSHVSSCRTLL